MPEKKKKKKKLLSLFLISSVLEGDRRGKKRTSRGDNTGKKKLKLLQIDKYYKK